MESDSDSDDSNNNICPICNRSFETIAGIKQHWTKSHSTSEIQTAIEQNSQEPVLPSSSVQAVRPARNDLPIQSAHDIVLNRVTCRICNFHSNRPTPTTQSALPEHFTIDFQGEANIIQKFGEILYKCKCSIPLVRIIQK